MGQRPSFCLVDPPSCSYAPTRCEPSTVDGAPSMSTGGRPGVDPDAMGPSLDAVFSIRGYGLSPLLFLSSVRTVNIIQSLVAGSRCTLRVPERAFRGPLRIVCMVGSGP